MTDAREPRADKVENSLIGVAFRTDDEIKSCRFLHNVSHNVVSTGAKVSTFLIGFVRSVDSC